MEETSDTQPPTTRDDLAVLIARAYPAIRRMAAAQARMSGARLDATSLANDAVCRLLRSATLPASDDHLHALAWNAIKWAFLDRARSNEARTKRETLHNGSHTPLPPSPATGVDHAMAELSARYPDRADVFVLYELGGLTLQQIAASLSISVQRHYDFAAAFLASELEDGAAQ